MQVGIVRPLMYLLDRIEVQLAVCVDTEFLYRHLCGCSLLALQQLN